MARLQGIVLWAWYRPAHLPSGVVVSIPAELLTACPGGFPMTLGDVLTATGVPPQQFQGVSLFGCEWQSASVFAPFVNHPLPVVPAGGRAEILIAVGEQQVMMPMMPVVSMHQPGTTVFGTETAAMLAEANSFTGQAVYPGLLSDDVNQSFADDAEFEDNGAPLTEDMMYLRIEAAWKGARQIERQTTGLRQKLGSMQAVLGKLDRDLSPDERLAADREDRDDWADVRRWLRDLQAKCHREIKAFDIGMTSGAGGRRHLEDVFLTKIEPRAAGGQLEVYRAEFEQFRKDMVSLQRAMGTALQAASLNGTQRAQRILGKIAGKIREMRARNREPLGGTNIDRTVRKKS